MGNTNIDIIITRKIEEQQISILLMDHNK